MKIFLTADTHFGHANILKHEPKRKELFGTVEKMDEELIRRWNEVVTDKDVIYHLGDFSMKPSVTEKILPRLNGCQKFLIGGNHDKVFPNQTKPQHIERLLKAGFDDVVDGGLKLPILTKNHRTVSIVMCHYPYLEDEAEVAKELGYALRYEDIRPKKEGDLLLHGHVHSRWKFRPHCINVGVDVWDYKPVLRDEVIDAYLAWLAKKN